MATNNLLAAGIVAPLVLGVVGMVAISTAAEYSYSDEYIKVEKVGEGIIGFTSLDPNGYIISDYFDDNVNDSGYDFVMDLSEFEPGTYPFAYLDEDDVLHEYDLIINSNGSWKVVPAQRH